MPEPNDPKTEEQPEAYLWDENGDKVDDPVIQEPPNQYDPFTKDVPDSGQEDKKVTLKALKESASASSLGLFLIFALIFAYFIGSWCDRLFGTKPVLTLVWLGFGVAATVLEAVKTIRAAQKLGDKKDS